MINKNFPVQPQLTNERLKEAEMVEQKKDDQNTTGDLDSMKHHSLNRTIQPDIGVTTTSQLNMTENSQDILFSKNLSKRDLSTLNDEKLNQYVQKRISLSTTSPIAEEGLTDNEKKLNDPSTIKGGVFQPADCLIPKDKQWKSFLKDFFKQIPIQESYINRITSLQKKAREIKEIVFLIENCSHNSGYGNLNLFIEFLRNFVRLSPGTLSLIRFTGCTQTLRNKLPNLISGLPDHGVGDLITDEDDRLLSLRKTPDKIFGIPYIAQDRIPIDLLSKNTLQIYTLWDSFKTSPKAPLFQITNYRWFPMAVKKDLLQNPENHLPIYPYEVSKNTSTRQLMQREIADSLQAMNPAKHSYDTAKLTHFFTELLQSAKENKIYLTLSYHAKGMTKSMYLNYASAAKSCFNDKPIIIIAPHNEKNYLSEKGRKELCDTGKLRFSTDYTLHFINEKSFKDNVTVYEFSYLPKRLFELVCYFSNIPIYAPGASTANIAQCLNKPYLGLHGHGMPTTGNPELLGRWKVANDAFYLDSFGIQEVKSNLLTMSKEQIRLSDRTNHELWYDPENAHLELNKISSKITDDILTHRVLITTLIPHFFNGTNTSKIHKYPLISPDDRQRYFTRLLDEGRLPEFCQYVCDQSNEILRDYMSRATTPGESFYELTSELQQKALHPDNNMMLEVLERNLPNH